MKRRARGGAQWLVLAGFPVLVRLAGAQERIVPLRPLGRTVATTSRDIPEVTGLRQLSDGRVLVFDQADNRLLILDSTLAVRDVIIDTVPREARRIGFTFRHDALAPYRGDSTLQVAAGARLLAVLDPTGRVVRTLPMPPTSASMIADRQLLGGVDAAGNLVYMGKAPTQFPPGHANGDSIVPIPGTDSVPIMRRDVATGLTAIVGRIRVPVAPRSVYATIEVHAYNHVVDVWCPVQIQNPLEVRDDWVLLSDGSVALVRATDSRVEWIDRDGEHHLSPPIVSDRSRLSLRDKEALIDSARRAQGPLSCAGLPAGQTGPLPRFVETSEIAAYRPAFVAGGSWADADGNVWLQRTLPVGAVQEPIYDVVNRRRGLIDRVAIPVGSTIAGFGPGVVYLLTQKVGGVRLEKARIAYQTRRDR